MINIHQNCKDLDYKFVEFLKIFSFFSSIKKHYSQTALYRNFAPHYFISSSKIESYFPLNEHSMLFADIPISQNFNKYLGDSASPAQQWLQLDRFRGTSLSTGMAIAFICLKYILKQYKNIFYCQYFKNILTFELSVRATVKVNLIHDL